MECYNVLIMNASSNISTLSQLKSLTTVVADTGDFEAMKAYGPQDATTNPTLILKAVEQDAYKPLLKQAIKDHKADDVPEAVRIHSIADTLLVLFGKEILKIVPGRVSTEVDARLSFDVQGSVEKARKLIALYEQSGVDRTRILIKLASTWEGVCAAEILEREGIHCNLTLMFSLVQAVACAQVGVTLISPFVGRIYDWYKAKQGREYSGVEDPGVQSVTQIYNYYKKHGIKTQIMGASFRNIGQIIELAGCDLLTISPKLLQELQDMRVSLVAKLTPDQAQKDGEEAFVVDEAFFRYHVNKDAMAIEKLAEGIRVFAEDVEKLETLIQSHL